MGAAAIGSADVESAGVVIVAAQGTGSATVSIGAYVVGRTGIKIVAGIRIVRVDTPVIRVTAVVGTGVVVVAYLRVRTDTETIRTAITQGAYIHIVAGDRIVYMHTARCRITVVVGAGVAVVAIEHTVGDAGSGCAGVSRRTGVPITARARRVLVETARGGAAGVQGAGVSVVAGQVPRAAAFPLVTDVAGRTGVAIVTGLNIICMGTANDGIADVIGAGVSITT